MEEGRILNLIKKPKNGLLRIVFSRLVIVFLMLGLQIFLYIAFFALISQFLPYFAVFQSVFAFGMVIYLFNNKMDSSAKLTWLALIAVLPVFGAFLLAFTQRNLGHRNMQKNMERIIKNTKKMLPQDNKVNDELSDDLYCTNNLHRYMNHSGAYPICDGTLVNYYPMGEDAFPVMLEELEKAEKFIFLEYFIIQEGYMWGRILDVLARKAAEGVDVRVLYDGTCEFSKLPSRYPQLLGNLGIKARMFAPIKPFLSSHYNYRDHRKIMVIDGKTAFSGGINLADEYINHTHPCGQWKDTAIMLKGKAVSSFTLMFLQLWELPNPYPEFGMDHLETDEYSEAEGFVMPFGECPLTENKLGEAVYMDILNRARSSVHIMTPYLILDDELKCALKYAAQRGVDVKLILPGIPDNKTAYALARSHYGELIDAGIGIYEYTPGMVHAKVCVSDECRAVVGTINLDYRSLYHHFECAAYLYKAPCISEIEQDFQQTLAVCCKITRAELKSERKLYNLAGAFLKVVAPLM